MKQELEDRVQRAVDNFMQGYGCCQSVVAAFADLYGVDDTLAKKISNVEVSVCTPKNGKIRFRVSPKGMGKATFFMRAKIRP